MIEIYYGDGKGKTTAAAGLAIRSAGHGIPVCFIQFLKDGSSGEVRVLKQLPGVTVRTGEHFYGFLSQMSPEQRQICRQDAARLLAGAGRYTQGKGRRVLILDEVLTAQDRGIVEERDLLNVLERTGPDAELVLTGCNPSKEILDRADYCTQMIKRAHPFDRGIRAREGIEY